MRLLKPAIFIGTAEFKVFDSLCFARLGSPPQNFLTLTFSICKNLFKTSAGTIKFPFQPVSKVSEKALKYFSEKGEIVYDEENSVKIKTSDYEVDLVKKFSPSKENTVADFDYTVCTGLVDRDGVYFTKEFMYALKNKKLQVNSLCNPIGAVKRIKKYAQRGYDLSNVELQKIVNKIAMTDVDELYASGQKLTGSYGGFKPQPKEEKKPNYALYGGIALAVLVGGYIISKRK